MFYYNFFITLFKINQLKESKIKCFIFGNEQLPFKELQLNNLNKQQVDKRERNIFKAREKKNNFLFEREMVQDKNYFIHFSAGD